MSPTAAAWSDLVDLLGPDRPTLLVAHVNPDVDAVGSALGLALALRADGRSVAVTFDGRPFVVPASLRWLPGCADLVRAPEDVPELLGGEQPQVVVALDCAAPDRLGRVLPVAEAADFAVLDHHRTNRGFAPVSVVDASAPATGVLVAELLDRMGFAWTPEIATALFAAISGDTGGFRFGTSERVFSLAAQLCERGADPVAISRRLYGSRPLGLARLIGSVLASAAYLPHALDGRGVLVGVVSASDRTAYDVAYDDAEAVVSDLATVADAEVAVVIKEDDAGHWKVSTRGKGALDLGAVCAGLGGGGHRQAAGYTSTGTDPDFVAAELLAALDAASANAAGGGQPG